MGMGGMGGMSRGGMGGGMGGMNRSGGMGGNRSSARSRAQSFSSMSMGGMSRGMGGGMSTAAAIGGAMGGGNRIGRGRYSNKSDEYKANVSRADHRAARQERRAEKGQAGSLGAELKSRINMPEWRKQAKAFNDAGSSMFGIPNQAAKIGPDGIYYDANNPTMIPKIEGVESGDLIFDNSRFTIHDQNKHLPKNYGQDLTGRVAFVKADGGIIPETTGYSSVNRNWDKYVKDNSERLSSEGLYGDEYKSNDRMGSIYSYFKDVDSGKKSFDESYYMFAGGNRADGDPSDVLKLIDEGRIKNVTNKEYNRVVVDAQNFEANRAYAAEQNANNPYNSRGSSARPKPGPTPGLGARPRGPKSRQSSALSDHQRYMELIEQGYSPSEAYQMVYG